MSGNRQFEWRPERKRAAGEKRARAKAGLSTLLFLLVAWLIWHLYPSPAPGVAFVVAYDPQGSAEPQASRLYTLLEQLRKENSGALSASYKLDKADEILSQAAKTPGETSLVLYLAATAETKVDSDVPSLKLKFGGREISLRELLQAVSKREDCTTLLLLDIVPTESGLSTGTLANDAADELRFEINDFGKLPSGVSVIMAFARGERNWEYFSEPAESENDSASLDPNDEGSGDKTYPRFEGTVFGHFVAEAVRTGQLKDVKGCHDFLAREVGDWVSSKYGTTQSVEIFPPGTPSVTVLLDEGLADRGLAGFLNSSEENPSGPASSQGGDSEETKKASGGETTKTPQMVTESPDTRIQSLFAKCDSSKETPLPLVDPGRWQTLQLTLLTAEKQLVLGQTSLASNSLDDAKMMLDGLENPKLETGTPVEIDPDLKKVMQWLDVDVSLLEETKEPDVPLQTIQQLLRTEKLPDGVQVSRSVVRELDLNSRLPNDRISEEIIKARDLFGKLPDKDLPLANFPSPLGIIYEVLAESGECQVLEQQALEQLVRLLTLRRQVSFFSIGYDTHRQPISDRAWREIGIEKKIINLSKELVAAQQWLKLAGERGADQAKSQLDNVKGSIDELDESLRLDRKRQEILARQIADSRWIIQYFAHLQDQSYPATETLNDMKSFMSADHLPEVIPTLRYVPSADFGFSREDLTAMWRLTADLSLETNVGDRVTAGDSFALSLKTLEEFLSRRMPGKRFRLSARERWWLQEIPSSVPNLQTTQRISVLRGLQTDDLATEKPISETGIWMGFWSIRLLESLSHKRLRDERKQWIRFADSVAADSGGPQSQKTIQLRADLEMKLQQTWTDVLKALDSAPDSTDFVAPVKYPRMFEVLKRDLALRRQVSSEQSLFANIGDIKELQSGKVETWTVDAISKRENIQLSEGGQGQLNLGAFTSTNTETLWISAGGTQVGRADMFDSKLGSWQRVLSAVPELPVNVQPASGQPQDMLIVVCKNDIPRSVRCFRLQTTSKTEWDLEAYYHPDEGNADESRVYLTDGLFSDGTPGLVLDLPPSTNPKKDLGIKFRLRRTKGSVSKVSVEVCVKNANKQTEDPLSGKMTLQIPEGQDFVNIPLVGPPPTVVGGEVVSSPASSAGNFDITRGFVVKVSWGDSATEAVNFGVIPLILDADRIFESPTAEFNPKTGELSLSVVRRTANFDGKVFLPSDLEVEVILNKALADLRVAGNTLRQPVNDNTPASFSLGFPGAEESRLPLEFGISVPGIPHAWWWRLEGDRAIPVTDLRVFFEPQEKEGNALQPALSRLPPIIEGFEKPWLKPTVYLHGRAELLKAGEFQLELLTETVNDKLSEPSPLRPELWSTVQVNSRFHQSVSATAGPDDIWKIRTATEPFTTRAFSSYELGVGSGRHRIIARLIKGTGDRDPVTNYAEFLLDASKPQLYLDGIPNEVQTDKLSKQQCKVQVEDRESGVVEISVQIDRDGVDPVTIWQANNVLETPAKAEMDPDFLQRLPGFPGDRPEIGDESRITLLIKATNGAGMSEEEKRQILLRWPPLPKPEEPKEPETPGSMTVSLDGSSEFKVRIRGPKNDMMTGKGSVTFADLPPGEYSVTWDPVIGSFGGGGLEDVVVESGKSTDVP